jgi:hypothetical protein
MPTASAAAIANARETFLNMTALLMKAVNANSGSAASGRSAAGALF